MAPRNLCTDIDSDCLLRDDQVNSEFLADLLVRLMAGEDVSALLGGRPSLDAKPQCVQCALRVMRGLAPLETVEHWEEEVRQGERFHRRHRRYGESGGPRDPFEPPFR